MRLHIFYKMVKLSLCLIPPFFNPTLDGGEWSASRHGRFTSWERGERARVTRRIRGLGGPQSRSGGYGEKKILFPLPEIEHKPSKPVACRYTRTDRALL
jgi:hypothetical protein